MTLWLRMSGKRNVSFCRGHEVANALYIKPYKTNGLSYIIELTNAKSISKLCVSYIRPVGLSMGVVRVMPQYSLGISLGMAYLRRHLLDPPHAIIMRLHRLGVSFYFILITEIYWAITPPPHLQHKDKMLELGQHRRGPWPTDGTPFPGGGVLEWKVPCTPKLLNASL